MADLGAMLAPDLRKRIEIMADHIARNGSDFETTVKQKNASNPQFSFLYSGEGAEYYQQVLARHRGTQVPAAAPPAPPAAPTAPMLAPTNPQPPPAPPAPPAPVQQTAHMSMAGMGAQLSAPSAPTAGSLATLLRGGQVQGAPPVELADVLRRWKEPQVLALTPEVERQLHGVLASLEHMASRDAIKSGRLWIECNSALAPHIAGHIMVRVSFLSTCAHRLHVLYLVHDLLQTEAARKDAHAPLVRAFKPYLPWILRPCYQLALQSPQGDETSRVLRLVQLWVDRGILSAQEAEEVKAITMTQELPGVQPPVAQAAAAALRPITSVPAPPMPGMAGALRPAMPVAPCMAPFVNRSGCPKRWAGAAMPAVPMLHGYQKPARAVGAELCRSLARSWLDCSTAACRRRSLKAKVLPAPHVPARSGCGLNNFGGELKAFSGNSGGRWAQGGALCPRFGAGRSHCGNERRTCCEFGLHDLGIQTTSWRRSRPRGLVGFAPDGAPASRPSRPCDVAFSVFACLPCAFKAKAGCLTYGSWTSRLRPADPFEEALTEHRTSRWTWSLVAWLETVPVGVLASMLAGVSQAQGGRFARHKPLDPAMTPQALPAMEDRRSSSSSSSSRSRSREPRESREYESTRHLGGGFGGFGGFSTMSAVPPPVC
ncbi:Cherp [Symbiodinium sp. CCMP2592]|nr:Cherp [Symbiodinium sp. CCMP2592]